MSKYEFEVTVRFSDNGYVRSASSSGSSQCQGEGGEAFAREAIRAVYQCAPDAIWSLALIRAMAAGMGDLSACPVLRALAAAAELHEPVHDFNDCLSLVVDFRKLVGFGDGEVGYEELELARAKLTRLAAQWPGLTLVNVPPSSAA